MRPAVFVPLCLLACAACEPGSSVRVIPVNVQWMEWPSAVAAGTGFRTRLVVSGVCALEPRFGPGARTDLSAVTFAPYFTTDKQPIACITELVAMGAIDTAGMAPGLQPGTYEMRAASYAPTGATLADAIPDRTFGQIQVGLPGDLITATRTAAGFASVIVDSTGCARIRPLGLYAPGAALALENPVDTAGLSDRFVCGYVYAPAAPVCGDSVAFHLLYRN